MKVSELKRILEGTGAIVKETSVDRDQDPFVLYSRNYDLGVRVFMTNAEIRDFFRGKKIVARDFDANPREGVMIEFWVHSDEVTERELGK